MTPKEKAKELFDKYLKCMYYEDEFKIEYAKQCALIAAEEILNVLLQINETYEERAYWNEVIKELINI